MAVNILISFKQKKNEPIDISGVDPIYATTHIYLLHHIIIIFCAFKKLNSDKQARNSNYYGKNNS